MKRCSNCHQEKLLGEFHRNRAGRDGCQNWCKQCRATYNLIHSPKAQERLRLSAKKRKRCSVCQEIQPLDQFYHSKSSKDGYQGRCKTCDREIQRMYNRSFAGRETQRRKRQMRLKAHLAMETVQRAVKIGKMPHVNTLICADCGQQAEEYHHKDYSCPLNVVALCKKCHHIRHC